MHQRFALDIRQAELLGKYVYALIDPRDRYVLYVGQGQIDRINDHFIEAERALVSPESASSKAKRIVQIWNDEKDVEIVFLRRQLQSDYEASQVEGSLIAALGWSANGRTLNQTNAPFSRIHGALTLKELADMAAPPVSFSVPVSAMWLFNIANTFKARGPYEATRSSWIIGAQLRNRVPAIAVGLVNGVSQGAYYFHRWEKDPIEPTKWRFEADFHHDTSALVQKNWHSIIGTASGYWKRGGGQTAIEVDDRGRFRFLKGVIDKLSWHGVEA